MKYLKTTCISRFGFGCFVFVNIMTVAASALSAADPKPAPIVIALQLDKAEAHPGDLVRLTEMVPPKPEYDIWSIRHVVYKIGDYDPKTGRMTNRPIEDAARVGGGFDNERYFTGLLDGGFFSAPFGYRILTPRAIGNEHEMSPKRLGVYLITSTWDVGQERTPISSQPVVLVVKPPIDKDGKFVVKPEWLNP